MTFTKLGLYSTALLGTLVLLGQQPTLVKADTPTVETTATPAQSPYTDAEAKKIRSIQQRYQTLDQTEYNAQTLYATPTNLTTAPFRVGQIKQHYIDATTQWVNYYRTLVNLPPIQTTNDQNYLSQIGAGILAGVNANPMLSQHGLANATKPAYISDIVWQQGQFVTNASNLYFRANGEHPGDTITGLIADNSNIDGNDTGHRAWILSPYLQNFGIGAAYGTNSWKYVDMMVMNNNWFDNVVAHPQKNIITYPSAGVFPIEALTDAVYNHHAVPWSIYFTEKQTLAGKLAVTVEDNTTKQQTTINDPLDASTYQFGSFKSVFTFTPNLPLTSGHQYTVTLTGLKDYPQGYTYQFKLFKAKTQDTEPDRHTALQQIDIAEKGVGTIRHVPNGKTAVLTAPIYGEVSGKLLANDTAWQTFGKTLINQQYFYNVGKNEWVNGRFLELSNLQKDGVLTIDNAPNNQIMAYDSPYYDQKQTGRYFRSNTAWQYHQIVNIGGIDWYNLGVGQWVPSTNVRVNH